MLNAAKFPSISLRAWLFRPIDGASLIAFRVAFGAIMFWHITRYFVNEDIGRFWVEPAFHFTYPGFDWVHPWPGAGMYFHMGILALLALFIAIGAFYRISSALFFVGFTYTFLLEHALYLNHLYFVCLVSFLMIFAPVHRAFSVDAWRRPESRSEVVPFWPLWMLRTQLAIVYFFGGVAKLNADWIRGEPLRSWLSAKSTTPIVGPLFHWDETYWIISGGGLVFDLLIVPLLLWKRTRGAAFVAATIFHLLNAWFFHIGIFPWFSIVMTTLFFEPDWPRRWLRRRREATPPSAVPTNPSTRIAQRRTVAMIGVYVMLQLLLPLRHWLYPGNVAWTEEGHEFSWRMRLREKTGTAVFEVVNPATMQAWLETADDHLESWQARAMLKRPELIRQFAHYLAACNAREVGGPVQVYVHSSVSLNAREPHPLIVPEIDLSKEPHRLGAAPWITPGP